MTLPFPLRPTGQRGARARRIAERFCLDAHTLAVADGMRAKAPSNRSELLLETGIEAMTAAEAITGTIFDLDGTLTDFNAQLTNAFKKASVEAALSLGVPFTPTEAEHLAQRGFDESRSYAKYFAPHLDERAFHYAYGLALVPATGLISPFPELARCFERVGFNNHVLITHSARLWAERVIRQLDLEDWFPHERILALEDCDFERKHKSRIPFELGLKKLNARPITTVAVDDTIQNLEIPYEMGMKTIFINRGQLLSSRPIFIRHEVRTPIEALALVAGMNG
jgi:FMN phosphatase YigB (HAD superfamily)